VCCPALISQIRKSFQFPDGCIRGNCGFCFDVADAIHFEKVRVSRLSCCGRHLHFHCSILAIFGVVLVSAGSRNIGQLGIALPPDAVAKAMIGHYTMSLVLPVRLLSQVANFLAVITWIVVVLSPWGERKPTEKGLRKIETALATIVPSGYREALRALKKSKRIHRQSAAWRVIWELSTIIWRTSSMRFKVARI
jgi:hypothetical protein